MNLRSSSSPVRSRLGVEAPRWRGFPTKACALLAASALAFAPGLAEAKKRKPKEPDTKPPVITHVRVTKAPRSKALTVRARFDDASEVFAPSLYVRERGAAEFESVPMKRAEDGYAAVISAEKMAKDLEYFIEVFDEEGNGPAREGSPEAPLTISVFDPGAVLQPPPPVEDTPPVEDKPPVKDPPKLEPKKDPPPRKDIVTQTNPDLRDRYDDENVATTWWFWTIIGVVVTGGIAGTVVLLQRGGDSPVDAVDIRVIGPDPTAGLE